MDVSAIAATATAISQGSTMEAVQVAVLKKAMDTEAQGAMELVQAVANNPAHLGNNVDTFA